MSNPLIDLIAEDNEVIPYRKSLRPITGSVTATILLQQMIFRSKGGKKVFYKFKAPCDHDLYKPGDSWTEEIGFSVREFDTALKKIGTKIKIGMSKDDVMNGDTPDCLIAYWTGRDRVTWYEVNVDLLSKLLNGIYLNDKSAFTRKMTKAHLDKDPENTRDNNIEDVKTVIPKNGKSKPDYLTDIATAAKKGVSEESAPHPMDQYFAHTDKFLEAYKQAEFFLGFVEKGVITDLSNEDGASWGVWKQAIEEAVKNWSGKSKRPPLQRVIDVYHHNGDYEKFAAATWPRQGEKPKRKYRWIPEPQGEIQDND